MVVTFDKPLDVDVFLSQRKGKFCSSRSIRVGDFFLYLLWRKRQEVVGDNKRLCGKFQGFN